MRISIINSGSRIRFGANIHKGGSRWSDVKRPYRARPIASADRRCACRTSTLRVAPADSIARNSKSSRGLRQWPAYPESRQDSCSSAFPPPRPRHGWRGNQYLPTIGRDRERQHRGSCRCVRRGRQADSEREGLRRSGNHRSNESARNVRSTDQRHNDNWSDACNALAISADPALRAAQALIDLIPSSAISPPFFPSAVNNDCTLSASSVEQRDQKTPGTPAAIDPQGGKPLVVFEHPRQGDIATVRM